MARRQEEERTRRKVGQRGSPAGKGEAEPEDGASRKRERQGEDGGAFVKSIPGEDGIGRIQHV